MLLQQKEAMPWTLGDVTAESVSSTSVDSTAVSANSITIQGSPVYAKRTIVITGMFNNIFSQTGGQDFLEWTSNTAPTSTIPTLLLPFELHDGVIFMPVVCGCASSVQQRERLVED